MAITRVLDGMLDNDQADLLDFNGPNDIRLNPNKCGCVYAFDLDDRYDVTYIKVGTRQGGNGLQSCCTVADHMGRKYCCKPECCSAGCSLIVLGE